MKRSIPLRIILIILVGFQLTACSSNQVSEKLQPSSLEPIEGSEFNRVILTDKAAERLGIQTALIQEKPIFRIHNFGSEVVNLIETTESESNSFWVRVSLTEEQQQMVDRSVPVYVVSDDDDEDDEGMIAEPDELREDDDPEDNFIHLYYKVTNTRQDISEGQRFLVKIPLAGNGGSQKVIPFAAVIYGVHGETWVYTNPEPLVFIREPVAIDFIEDDWAVLSEGPEVGTAVVIVGGAELFGTETGVSK